RELEITDVTDRLDEFKRLIELVAAEELTVKNAEEVVLREMLDEGDDPDAIVDREGLGKAESGEVEAAVEAAIDDNPDAVADYHDGDDGAINFLVGQVMQATGGSADPGQVNGLLRERLDG
ncbi:aspartyl/glutamyl-tRNA amidotransferase subunit B, partial [Halorubrum halodurans]